MSTTDMFLKIDKIDGESTDDKHKNEIDVLSWSWGANNSGTMSAGGGGGAGMVSMQDFQFSMYTSKASPLLMDYCARGEHIDKVVLTCRKAGGQPHEYLVLTFDKCLISSYQTGGAGGGDSIPIESISINFSKVTQDYNMQDDKGGNKGKVSKSYDLKARKGA